MAMASYAAPAFLDEFRELVRADGAGGFTVAPIDFARYAPALGKGEEWTPGARRSWPRRCSTGSRRSCSTSAPGCTTARATATS